MRRPVERLQAWRPQARRAAEEQEGSITDASLQSPVDDLTQGAGLLAARAFDDAVAARVDKIAAARAELAKATDALAKCKPDEAIDHDKNAWRKAGDALG